MIAAIYARKSTEGRKPTATAALGLFLFISALSGCASALPADRLHPGPISTEIPVIGWPVAVVIADNRPNRDVAHRDLIDAVRRTLMLAFPTESGVPCCLLTVTAFQHDARFEGSGSPFWRGETRLRAVLSEEGRELGRWDIEDVQREWNAFGWSSGTDAAQYSLRDALRKLLRRMAVVRWPAAKDGLR